MRRPGQRYRSWADVLAERLERALAETGDEPVEVAFTEQELDALRLQTWGEMEEPLSRARLRELLDKVEHAAAFKRQIELMMGR